MPLNYPSRTRSDRVAQFDLAPSRFVKAMEKLQRGDMILRVVVCLAAAVAMWLFSGGWHPPFSYRTHQTPSRDIVASTDFEVEDPTGTANAREDARRTVQCVYDHDVQLIVDLRKALKGRMFQVLSTPSPAEIDTALWEEFSPLDAEAEQYSPETAYIALRDALAGDDRLEQFEFNLVKALERVERYGVLEKVQHALGEGSQTEICVARLTDGQFLTQVPIEQVRKAEVLQRLKTRLAESFGNPAIGGPVFHWLRRQLPGTLKYNQTSSEEARRQAEDAVGTLMTPYRDGVDVLAKAHKPLTLEQVALLRHEYNTRVSRLPLASRLARVAAAIGMYIALYLLCGTYIYFRHPLLITNFRRFITLQILAVATVGLASLTASDKWQAELIPLLLFASIVAIAHGQEMALLLTAAMCLVVAMALGLGLAEFVVFAATMAATILLLRHIRSRTKLIYVGICAAIVAFLTALGVGIVTEQGPMFALLVAACWYALFAMLAMVIMTGILPFVEAAMEVQTEISLLELGDIAHPLLQELVQRAPGTYNHSINVASIAEAAAESIGANGLLVRVGSYFHDIGKMLKPQYFVENQGEDGNRHESLLPAMSTLIIIAHVKDGADLARQHHLPKSIVDFILQHHGTTLVEYFYNRASKQSEVNPHGGEVDEGSYRYPGPKPQTREAAVLMLADAVESASRTLQEPAPARIENLVEKIAMKRLLDGQFDDCQLTLQELRTIQKSLVKSLTAMYHGRVKYPGQQSA